MSRGALVAAVLIPILIAVAIFFPFFICLRRRTKQHRATPAMREKLNARARAAPVPPADGATMLMSISNNAYFTGLDTSSHGSASGRNSSGGYYAPPRRSEGGTSADPPPPYKPSSAGQTPKSIGSSHTLPVPSPPSAILELHKSPHTLASPFADPPAAAAAPPGPPTSRSTTARSISSTLYSSNAPVRSARPARASVGGTHIVAAASERNPFDDPLESSVSDVDRREGSLGLIEGME